MAAIQHDQLCAWIDGYARHVQNTGEYGVRSVLDVPGIKQADLDVSLTGNRLTITGKREAEKEDKGDTYYTYERSYGSFTRSFTLPEGVNASAIRADLHDGVLSVVLPKTPEAQPKKIPVSTEQKKA